MKKSLSQEILGVLDHNKFNHKVALILEKELDFPDKLFEVKLSCGSERSPLKTIDYYYRAVSILKKLVENPHGMKKLRWEYSRIKRGWVKPPKNCRATYYAIKLILMQLKDRGYLNWKENLGYYTSEKGKTLLSSNL